MSETKKQNTTSTATSPTPTPNNNQSGKNVTAQVGKVAAAATGAAATGWVTTGLKDFASRIRQEFIGANLYLIGFLIVLFLGIAFYVYNYYISPLFSKVMLQIKKYLKMALMV